ncbi:MAG: hypothetical protein ACK55Z_26455, partial [bacterium]
MFFNRILQLEVPMILFLTAAQGPLAFLRAPLQGIAPRAFLILPTHFPKLAISAPAIYLTFKSTLGTH